MTDFGGWLMPLQYSTGTVAEHRACRSSSVVFDVTHLGSVLVRGPGSFDHLQHSFTNDLNKVGPGRAQYTHLLADDGSVVDDIIVWWMAAEEFLVMPNASNTDGVLAAVGGTDVTDTRVLLAVQGPTSRALLTSCFGETCWTERFTVRESEIAGFPCVIAGTGYTGEVGVEIHVPVVGAERVWKELIDHGCVPAGLGARDTLRLEAGLPLHGHELGPGITPLQAGLGWVVGWDKGPFIGRDALMKEKENGPSRRLFGISTRGKRPPRTGSEVSRRGDVIGTVTSGNFSPLLDHGIALALLDPSCTIGDEVVVSVRGHDLEGRVVSLPFVEPTRPRTNR